MMSLAKPSAANRTIFARMTSRYGDVYLRALAVSSSRSILLNSMEYGLRRGIGTSRSGVCQTKRKSTLKIRHYIYEHEYLAIASRERLGSGEHERAAGIRDQQRLDRLIVGALAPEARDDVDEQVVVAEAAPARQAVLVRDVVRHQDLREVAALDQEEDLAHPLAVVRHVEGRVVRIVGRLQPEQVVLQVDARRRQLEEHHPVGDRALDVAHDRAAEIATLLANHFDDLER